MSIRDWSFMRIFTISVLWVLAVLLLLGWRSFAAFRGISETGGMVGISGSVPDLFKLAALLLLPPLGLIVAWAVQRH